jgi:hypothetical protein
MASAVPNGTSQINKPARMSEDILAQRLLLNSPYAVDKRIMVKSKPTMISARREESDRIRANSFSIVITLNSSTSRQQSIVRPGSCK